MATVNFSVPEEVKESFNRTFQGRNKSAIMADLMRRAVADVQAQESRRQAIQALTAQRKNRHLFDTETILDARDQNRR